MKKNIFKLPTVSPLENKHDGHVQIVSQSLYPVQVWFPCLWFVSTNLKSYPIYNFVFLPLNVIYKNFPISLKILQKQIFYKLLWK